MRQSTRILHSSFFTLHLSLLFELCQDGIELRLDARIHSVSIIFEDETTDDVGIHLSLELHSTLRSG